MSRYAIEVCGLEHDFGAAPVLRSVDLTVPRGSVFGLLGRNGGGKTTLIRMLLGMLKPRRGHCRVLGLDPAVDALEIRRRIGYVPQAMDFDPAMTVQQSLRFMAAFYPDRWQHDQVATWLKRFELDPDQRVGQLSGGQAGRLGLVSALAVDPELLILDEPTAGLDPVVRRDFASAVIEWIAEGERTALLSSHLLHEVERLADHVAILEDGEVLLAKSVEELKRDLTRVTARFVSPPAQLDLPSLAAKRLPDGWQVAAWTAGEQERQKLLDELTALGASELEVGTSNLDDIFVDLVGGPHV